MEYEIDDPKTRAELISKIAADLVDFANDIIIDDNYAEKIELMVEAFSESLLGLLKAYLVINPTVHPDLLMREFSKEMTEKIKDWMPTDQPIDTFIN